MNNPITNSLSGCFAQLSKLLSTVIKKDVNEEINQVSEKLNSFIKQLDKQKFKKPDEINYVQYFQKILSYLQNYSIKLKNKNDQFSLIEDLFILVTVTLNDNMIPFKSLQKWVKSNNTVYGPNQKNTIIKREVKKLFLRHRLLQKLIRQQEVKFIIEWIQKNGIFKNAYIYQNISKKHEKDLNIQILQQPLSNWDKIQRQNKFNRKDKAQQLYELQKETRIRQNNKKIKLNQELIDQKIDQTINSFKYETPQKQIQLIQPSAPIKKKLAKSKIKDSLKDIFVQQKRKVVKIIKQNREIVLKEQSMNHNEQQSKIQIQSQSNLKANNLQVSSKQQIQKSQQSIRLEIFQQKNNKNQKLKKEQEQVSDYSQSSQMQQGEMRLEISQFDTGMNQSQRSISFMQENIQLKKKIKKFKNKTNLSEEKILKYFDELSGDLNDLIEYLEKGYSKKRWKINQDQILKNYFKYADSQIDKQKFQVHNILYEELLKSKGKQNVQKRIKYLKIGQSKVN